MKKLLAIVMALVMCLSLLPVSAFAVYEVNSGDCGEYLTWTLDSDGTLTISGTGAMYDYDTYYAPWDYYSYDIVAVVIEPGVTSIGIEAFSGCYSLESIIIPNGVTSIGDLTFSGCSSLESVVIPNGVTSIGDLTFSGCSSLESVVLPNGLRSIGYCAFSGCGSLKNIAIPNSVTSIGTWAFENCSSLNSVTIPGNVVKIGYGVFSDCSCLESISVSANNNNYCSADGVLFNKEKTKLIHYPAAKADASYSVPGSVSTIVDSAFSGCYGINELKMTGVKTIEAEAFKGCYNLKSITIPNSVTSIQYGSFRECYSLKSAVIPNSVTSIQYGTFRGCGSLASVSVPASVKKIVEGAFFACGSLKDVYYSGSSAQWKSVEIDKNGNDALIKAKLHCSPIGVPTIKITTSAGKPKISWNKIDGAKKYKIYRSTDGENYKYLTYTTKTSYTNTKATIGTKYYYKVTAVNAGGTESAYSNIKSIKCVPATPTVSISRSSGKAKLSWKAVTGATKYYIYRSTDGKTYKYYTYTTKLNYTDSKSASGTKYYYKVKAVAVVNGTNVGSAYSAVKSIMTTLAKPTVKITTSNGKPKLTWKAVTGADKYIVYRSTDGKTFKQYTTTTKTSFTNTSAKKNTKYYYKVKAVCSSSTNANSAYSTVVSIKATK